MDTRPSESLKTIATSLAGLITAHSSDREKMAFLLKELSGTPIENQADEEKNTANISVEEPISIGIWKKCIENNTLFYERDADMNIDWPLWANVHRLYPKKDKTRVLLLGESVARGYFYDPYYTVALELEGILNKLPEARGQEMEVIDLARTNLRMDGLTALVRGCTALDPDAVVIFAGNNWFPNLRDAMTDSDYKKMYQRFREDSFGGLKSFLEEKFREMIRSFLKEIEQTLTFKNIPVVFIIPGFNLKDWKSDHIGKSLPWLPDDAVTKWLEARAAAESAWADREWERMGASAAEMVTIDPFNPHGYELLAEYFIVNRKWSDARKCLETCRDSILVNRGGNNHPRCFGIIRDTLLEEAGGAGVVLVDSPAIFNEFMQDGIADRTLFFDYCHLTLEGIRLSMRHAASVLIRALTGKDLPVGQIKDSGTEPNKLVKAIAHFCAAIHNAHNDQTAEIVRYHCRKSLSFSVEVKETMLQFIDFASRYSPTILCRTFEQIILNGKMRQYEGGFALRPPRGRKLMDIKLVDAISASLSAIGIHIEPEISKLRAQEHLIAEDRINLMESFYSTTTYQDFLIAEPIPVYSQARSTESVFTFISDGKCPLYFELVYRTPKRYSPKEKIRIIVNQKKEEAIELPMSEKWSARSFLIGWDLLTDGVNKLEISWPYSAMPLEEVEGDISPTRFLNALLPVLGEIHSFTAVTGKESLVPEKVFLKNY
ncbi:hypothetical protein ACX0G9_21740 [Flavitalea flava]